MCTWGIYVVSSSCLESLSSALLKTFTPLPEPDPADSNIYSRIDRGCIRKTSNLIFLTVYGRTTSKMEKSNSLSASKRIGILYTRAGIASRNHLPRLYREIIAQFQISISTPSYLRPLFYRQPRCIPRIGTPQGSRKSEGRRWR